MRDSQGYQATTSTVVGARTPSLFSRTLAQHTARVVADHPHREALVVADTGSRLSFGNLHTKSLALGRLLQRHGLGSGDRLAVWLRNGEEWVVTLLACAAAQVTVAAIPAQCSAAELRAALELADAKGLVLAPAGANGVALLDAAAPGLRSHGRCALLPSLQLVLTFGGAPVPGLLAAEELLCRMDVDPIVDTTNRPAFNANSAQLVCYTSGSTGTSRGVVLSGAEVTANAYFVGMRKGVVGGLDVGCVVQPLSHVGGLVVNLLAQFVNGATSVVASPAFDARAALMQVELEGCTVLDGVPSHFAMCLRLSSLSDIDLVALCKGTIGGAHLAHQLLQDVVEDRPGALGMDLLTVSYGMTETSPVSFMGAPSDSLSLRTTTVGSIQVTPLFLAPRSPRLAPHRTAPITHPHTLHSPSSSWMIAR